VAELVPESAIVRGTWAQGFVDYERHENLAPGQGENPTRKSVSAGGLAGIDWSKRSFSSGMPKAIQAGVFAGYNNTDSDFSTTEFISPIDPDDTISRLNNSQEIEGAFLGAYLGYLNGNFSADLAFKADIFDLEQSSTLRLQNPTCGFGDGIQRGTADMVDYVVASNLYYRHALSSGSWLEPTVGARLTITDYSDDRNVVNYANTTSIGTLGLEDGHAFRLQAGMRFGEAGVAPSGWLWTYTLGAFIYSDVAIEGLESSTTGTSVAGAVVSPVDEGEVRVMGQVMAMVGDGHGSSYSLSVETRGGEDVFGVGGLIGYRYEW